MTGRPWALRFTLWLLNRRLSPPWAEFVLGDLEETFRRRSERSRAGATIWLLRQALLCSVAPLPRSRRRAAIEARRPVTFHGPVRCVREAMRAFRARPLLTATCVTITAVGIGSATAVSSAVYALLFRPLPLPQSERVLTGFALREGFDPFGTSILEFSAFRSRSASFETAGLARQQASTVRLGNETVRVQSAAITADYLSTAGVHPALGRTIGPNDDRPGAAAVALVSHGLWVTRLSQRADALGSTLIIDGHPTTIVGIMPPGFDLPFSAEIWVPLQLAMDALPLEQRLPSAYALIARLRDGVTLDRANHEIAGIARALAEEYPQRRGWTYRLIGLRQQLLGDIDGRTTRVIGLVLASVAFLLGICCVNVANLLLLRAAERQRDEAVRLAVGASSRQLAAERFTEYALIGLAGGAAGIIVASWITPALASLNPVQATAFSPVLTDFRVDAVMLVIGGLISVAAALVIGLVPRVRLSSAPDLAATLVSSGSRAGISRARRARLRLLVATQIAVAVMLLVGSGLVLRSFEALRRAELGFRPDGLVSTQLTLPQSAYADHRLRSAELARLLGAIRTIPGVSGAGITTNIPLQHLSFDSFYTVEGAVVTNPNDVPITAHRVVTPDYLRLLGVRLTRGRLLADADSADAPRVVVVSEELARQAWPGRDPIGRRIRRGRATAAFPWMTVVGVVGDVKEDRFNFRTDRAVWYLPYAQEDSTASPHVVIAGAGDRNALAHAVRARVRAFDPDIGISEPVELQAHVTELLATERFAAVLLSMLAIAGLFLATLGLYGAVSHLVSAQRAEIALRLAVGAPRGHVVRMVLREVALLAVAGAVFGTALAAVGTLGLRNILYEVQPHDAATYAAVALVLVLASALAAYAPAARAARIDPARLLR